MIAIRVRFRVTFDGLLLIATFSLLNVIMDVWQVLSPQQRTAVSILSVRAQKKWSQIDVDQNGEIDGEEALSLAEWVWSSFRF